MAEFYCCRKAGLAGEESERLSMYRKKHLLCCIAVALVLPIAWPTGRIGWERHPKRSNPILITAVTQVEDAETSHESIRGVSDKSVPNRSQTRRHPKTKHPHLSERLLIAPRVWRSGAQWNITDLTWSPDGRWAAYYLNEQREPNEQGETPTDWERGSLCCIRADGRRAHRLYTGQDTHQGPDGFEPEMIRWSPDGRHLLFWKMVWHSSSTNADGSRLFDVSVLGGKPRLVTRPSLHSRDEFMMRDPDTLAFSPNGKYLLLVRGGGRTFIENKQLVCMDYPTGKQKWLTRRSLAVSLPVWSPNGRQIAFVACPDPKTNWSSNDYDGRVERTHLWISDMDGRKQRQLTHNPHFRELTAKWLQSGSVIRFIRQENRPPDDGQQSVWQIHADGSGLRRIRSL